MKRADLIANTLAKDRTLLANERTLLAYWRTSLSFLLLGTFLIKFVSSDIFLVLGIASLFFGIVLFIFSLFRYSSLKEKIRNEKYLEE